MTLRYVSTFLSHSPERKGVAHSLAHELTRRGMVVWTDRSELPVGLDVPHEEVPDETAAQIPVLARSIADAHYKRCELRDAPRVAIAIDQRGGGRRVGIVGEEIFPAGWPGEVMPALVFRPDRDVRSISEVCAGDAWNSFRDTLVDALGTALGTRRPREVFVAGNGQLALAWLVGTWFDRSSLAKIETVNPRQAGQPLSLDMKERRFALPLKLFEPEQVQWRNVTPDRHTSTVSVYLGPAKYESAVHAYRAEVGDTTPFTAQYSWYLEHNDEVIDLARWLATAVHGRRLRLYTALPFHALVLIAGLLKHQVGHVTLMERQSGAGTYTPCAMAEA